MHVCCCKCTLYRARPASSTFPATVPERPLLTHVTRTLMSSPPAVCLLPNLCPIQSDTASEAQLSEISSLALGPQSLHLYFSDDTLWFRLKEEMQPAE